MNILKCFFCPFNRKFRKILYSEMTAFGESDKKRIFDSMTPEDLTILKGAFAVYDKGRKGLHLNRIETNFIPRTICGWEIS